MKTNFIKIICSLLVLTVMGCKTAKVPATDAEISRLKTLVEKKEFKIESDWAYPSSSMAMQKAALYMSPGNSASSISLIGNSNFLTLSGDSITSFLPYFGERLMGAGYNDEDGAIKLIGSIANYKVKQNKDFSYDISFDAKSLSENFKVTIKIYTSLKASMVLTGNTRFPISYTGRIITENQTQEQE